MRVFKEKDIEFTNPVILTVASEDYSMPVAVGLLAWLESNAAEIKDSSWTSKDYGNLVEKGIEVEFENVTFSVSCSYQHVYFERTGGNKTNFWGLCKLFCETEL
ncbi:hypothetical protein NBRC116493_03890 [Aurantivibrio infirmus]